MADIQRYAHPHTFPTGNVHRHVHHREEGHPDLFSEAHTLEDFGYCVDCEPHRAQRQAAKDIAALVTGDA